MLQPILQPTELKMNIGAVRKNECLDLLVRIANKQDSFNSDTLTQLMKHGLLNTIPRPRGKERSGTLQTLLDEWMLKWVNRCRFVFDRRGIAHKEFVPPEQTVNRFPWEAQKKTILMRLDIGENRLRHHDNALSISEFFTRKDIPVVPHLFPWSRSVWCKLKNVLKSRHFGA